MNILAQGHIVMAERIDRTMVGDRRVELPCCGVFLLDDSKISVGRGYFDLATYARAIAATE
ncbi:limonene-1,2-epoxide hydrolase family protein [Camelimonas sp. ID_303_24]